MRLNENGILITKDGGQTYGTAIGVDGIVADMIKAGGTISGCNAVFGNIGSAKTGDGITIGTDGTFRTYTNGQEAWDISQNENSASLAVHGKNKGAGEKITPLRITASCDSSGNMVQFLTNEGDTNVNWEFYNWSGGRIAFDTFGGFSTVARNGIELTGGWIDLNSQDYPVSITGGLSVSGSKNAIVPTQHYGARLLYCEEGDKAYFTTKGIAETVNCEQTISLDPIFTETIELNSNYPYIIQLTSYSDAKVWIEQVNDYDFIVKSDKETKFTYELSALRITFGDVYLEEQAMSNKNKKSIQKAGIDRMNKNYKEKEVM